MRLPYNVVSQVSSGTVVQAKQLLEKMLRQCNAPLSEENKVHTHTRHV